MSWPHWIVLPIIAPLLGASVVLLLERRHPRVAAVLALAIASGLVVLAGGLAVSAADGVVRPYLLGNWAVPFGISLALDRLSAMMLVLTAIVGLVGILYACGGDARRGAHFHALMLFQLAGLNGAFLTADLFNLFVFFEVLLIASYGLLLHGAGAARLRASLHYVAFNLAGSALFLIAVSLLYGLTGTLSMADLAQRIAEFPAQDATLLRAAALLLLVVFAVKAALLPLYFWLPETYSSASAPAAAVFAIMTKVGVYAIARTTTLAFGADAPGPVAGAADPWLVALALATLALGATGAVAARQLRVLIAYLVVASAGTLITAVALGTHGTLAAGLFYLINSTLAAAAMFLLADRIARMRGAACDAIQPARINAQPARIGMLFFMLALAFGGMPPFAGFLGKSWLMREAFETPSAVWVWAVVLPTSLAVVVALARAGSTMFWSAPREPAPARSHPVQQAPQSSDAAPGARPNQEPALQRNGNVGRNLAIGMLAVLLAATTLAAGTLGRYTDATAAQLLQRQPYIEALRTAQPVPARFDPRREMHERQMREYRSAPSTPGADAERSSR